MKLETISLVNREAQVSNTAVYRKDLPKSGVVSAVDIGIRLTNGATSAINMDLLEVLKHISLVINGNENRYYLTGPEMFRHYWMKHGSPMPYTFKESASGVQEVWLRMEFGRFLGDMFYGLDLSRFDSAQIQIDYDCTVWGAVAATTFATGTFTVSMIIHKFPDASRPAVRSMIGTREFYSGTSASSGELVVAMPTQRPVIAVALSVLCDNVAEGADITDIRIGKALTQSNWVNNKYYNLQSIANAELDVNEETFNVLLSNGQVRDTHLANLKSALTIGRTASAAGAG